MKLRFKKNKLTGGYYTKVNGDQYNVTKSRVTGLWSANKVGGAVLTTTAKTRGWAEDAIICSVTRWDESTSWIAEV